MTSNQNIISYVMNSQFIQGLGECREDSLSFKKRNQELRPRDLQALILRFFPGK